MQRLELIDTHTGGEPTRVVFSGEPERRCGSLAERLHWLRSECDHYRRAILAEPRGSDVMVGAYLCEPVDPTCAAGVIFFNNVGYLNMCGHGTMGVAVALAHLGRIGPGRHRLETPVGVVSFEYLGDNRVRIENVPSYRTQRDVLLPVPDHGDVRGDVAWGGNWFFLSGDHGESVAFSQIDRLTVLAQAMRRQLTARRVTGDNAAEIDHIELFGPPQDPVNHARNFVLCPGGAYDRSPCGTGTSAKIACLAAEGVLAPGEVWRQESIVGSLFEASYHLDAAGRVIPEVLGTAFVNGEATLLLDPRDPFCWGIPG